MCALYGGRFWTRWSLRRTYNITFKVKKKRIKSWKKRKATYLLSFLSGLPVSWELTSARWKEITRLRLISLCVRVYWASFHIIKKKREHACCLISFSYILYYSQMLPTNDNTPPPAAADVTCIRNFVCSAKAPHTLRHRLPQVRILFRYHLTTTTQKALWACEIETT